MAEVIWRGFHHGVGGKPLESFFRLISEADNSVLLGKGTYGAVYRHEADGRKYAVKVLPRRPNEFLSVDAVRELTSFKALSGAPYVCQLRETWYDDGHYYLFMDYQYATLHQLISRRRTDLSRHLPQLCSGMYIMHQQGILHNDVKPANILASKKGDLFFSDYGNSRTVSCAKPNAVALGKTTEVFSAPEELASEDVSRATDIYSLGVTFACMLAGRTYPYTNSIDMLCLLNNMEKPQMKRLIAGKRFSELSFQITLDSLKQMFRRDIAEDLRRRKIRAAEASAQLRHLDDMETPEDLEQDINAMLSTNPLLRPSAGSLRSIGVLPYAVGFRRRDVLPRMDFMRCFPKSNVSSAVRFLSGLVSAHGLPGRVLPLVLDLAERLSQSCHNMRCSVYEYLLLCLFLNFKIYQGVASTVEEYNAELRRYRIYDPRFDPVKAELEALSGVDFNGFSCAEDEIRSLYEGKTVEQAAAQYLELRGSPGRFRH